MGLQGLQGLPGATGSSGSQGGAGQQGIAGAKGDAGAQGATGASGATAPRARRACKAPRPARRVGRDGTSRPGRRDEDRLSCRRGRGSPNDAPRTTIFAEDGLTLKGTCWRAFSPVVIGYGTDLLTSTSVAGTQLSVIYSRSIADGGFTSPRPAFGPADGDIYVARLNNLVHGTTPVAGTLIWSAPGGIEVTVHFQVVRISADSQGNGQCLIGGWALHAAG